VVFIIAGAAESARHTVGRLLAEALGWEFVDAEKLRPPGNLDACRSSILLANDDRTLFKTLSAAINFWIYEWRDVVASCPALTEGDRRQLSRMSSLVKIVCLEEYHATSRTPVLDQPVDASFQLAAGWQAARQPGDVLTLDSSRRVEEIVAEMTALLMM